MKVTAKATRSGDWWAVEVPEVPGVFTQAKRLDQVPAMVADAVETMLDVPSADVEVTIIGAVDGELDAVIAEALAAAADASNAQARASRATRNAVAKLRQAELPVRDVATLLHVSHQRVSQLAKH